MWEVAPCCSGSLSTVALAVLAKEGTCLEGCGEQNSLHNTFSKLRD